MNDMELDSALRELSARRAETPDLRAATFSEIRRRSTTPAALPSGAALYAASLLAAAVIGVGLSHAIPERIPRGDPRAEAAEALHLSAFHAPVLLADASLPSSGRP